jgi:hypothetical protein
MQNPNGPRTPRNKGPAAAQLELGLPMKPEEPLCETLRKKGDWAVCGAEKMPSKKAYAEELERALFARAAANPGMGVVVTTWDQADLNRINKAGDRSGAGDAVVNRLAPAIITETTEGAYSASCGRPYKERDSENSDEKKAVAAGSFDSLMRGGKQALFAAFEEARKRFGPRLKDYGYFARKLRLGRDGTVVTRSGEPEVELVPMTLKKFAAAMRDPSVLTKSHIGVSPVLLLSEQTPGFISRAVEEICRDEVPFLHELPRAFRPELPPKPGESPFESERAVKDRLPPGTVALEIKFTPIIEADSLAPLEYISVTNKGLAEGLSKRHGVRSFNSNMGHAVADHIIYAVGLAMKEFGEITGRRVMKTDSNFIYVVEGAVPEEAAALATALIARRVNSGRVTSDGHLDFGFRPSIVAIGADGMHVNDIRAAAELASMGMRGLAPEVLTYADLVIASASLFREEVITEALSAVLRDGGAPRSAGAAMGTVRDACLRNLAIRDTPDYVWSLRAQGMSEMEANFWEFAKVWGKRLRNGLIDVISGL